MVRHPTTRDEVLHTLSEFERQCGEEYSLVRIGLFGSAARGHLTLRSDVDVVVEMSRPDLLKLAGIRQVLEERLHRPVDVVRYREGMNPFLKSRIEREAIYV